MKSKSLAELLLMAPSNYRALPPPSFSLLRYGVKIIALLLKMKQDLERLFNLISGGITAGDMGNASLLI